MLVMLAKRALKWRGVLIILLIIAIRMAYQKLQQVYIKHLEMSSINNGRRGSYSTKVTYEIFIARPRNHREKENVA